VLVVTAEDRVESRQVQIGDRGADLWAVTAGLKPGERVIVEGLTKAVPGMVVKPEETSLDAAAGPDVTKAPASAQSQAPPTPQQQPQTSKP
jgi:membrane fusion protein (multidrug efflux system)